LGEGLFVFSRHNLYDHLKGRRQAHRVAVGVRQRRQLFGLDRRVGVELDFELIALSTDGAR